MIEEQTTRRLLRNWIEQANSPLGTFADDVDRADWVAERFMASWCAEVTTLLNGAEGTTQSISDRLTELGFSRADETQDEVLDLIESLLRDLDRVRTVLGLKMQENGQPVSAGDAETSAPEK